MKKISGLLKVISNKTGVPAEKLKKELEEGKFDSALSAMNRNDAARFQQAVNNPKIVEKKNEKVARMSFGQQQRVALMRALVQPFDFLLADEPISHLDDGNSRIMADIMIREAQSQGAGVIITSIGKHMDLKYHQTYQL